MVVSGSGVPDLGPKEQLSNTIQNFETWTIPNIGREKTVDGRSVAAPFGEPLFQTLKLRELSTYWRKVLQQSLQGWNLAPSGDGKDFISVV